MTVCLLLAVLHTWPLALHPGRYSNNDNADAQLNEWIMAWIAHQLPRAPLHLFEANIFYPAHDALAFSEPLIVPALIGAPLAWAGATPVLVYNIVLVLGFALTAFATCLLVDEWTGSLAAGLAAGSLFAFNTHTLTRLPHIQGIHLYGLPIALLAIDRLVREPSRRSTTYLAASMVLLAFTSGYLVVFATVMIAIAVLVRVREWLPHARPFLMQAGVAAAVTTVAVLPLYLPYARVARDQHMVRTLDAVKDFSATPTGYLATAARLHMSTWSGRFYTDPVNSFFPGFTMLALSVVAVASAFRRHPAPADPLRARVLMLLAIGAAGFILSLGTATPVYGWLFHLFPPMQGLRAAARFGNLFLLSVALLGGIGLAQLLPPEGGSDKNAGLRAFRLQAEGSWLAIALVALVNIESLRAPIAYQPFNGVPAIYTMLKDEPGPVVIAEQPFFPRWTIFENGRYVLASTAHWRPLMNGYSGYTPASYQRYADAFWYFPEDWAVQAMKDAGVTHVVVHAKLFARDHQDPFPAIARRTDFELMAIGDEGIRLYRLKRQ